MRRPYILKRTKQNHLSVNGMSCLAKTRKLSDQILPGRSVFEHCSIVGELAKGIFKLFPIGSLENISEDDVGFIASLHDIGKISPDFQNKLSKVITANQENDYVKNSDNERVYQFHGGATYISLRDLGIPDYLAWAIGSHHQILYKPPLSLLSSTSPSLGERNWQAARKELFETLRKKFPSNAKFENIENGQSRVIAGITQQADWLASGKNFENPTTSWASLIDKSLTEAGYNRLNICPGLSFEDIFGFKAHPIQKNFFDIINSPGIYVLEAPMGVGKTEAALYAAYKLIEHKLARGIYFALPTRLTSLKIWERINQFLNRIHEPKNSLSQLVIGGSLSGEFSPGGAWFSAKNRRILDNFGVGTIDQALMAVMLNRRSFVTLSGLAGKVVVLDEVHSYDSYTRVMIDVLVQELFKLGSTVLILSATLSTQSRKELLNIELNEGSQKLKKEYPLISAIQKSGNFIEVIQPIEHSKTVDLCLCKNTFETIEEAIQRASEGQQVLWIENSVHNAQSIYLTLVSTEIPEIEIGLLHSRYLPEHRRKLEHYWVSIFGKHAGNTRNLKGRILVGTQVLEQSLDIDADFLVTRLAPMDMLLQRLGRLWRHQQTQRPNGSKCEAVILIPASYNEALTNTPKDFEATFAVYQPYVLMKTLKALYEFPLNWSIPESVRDLIENVYSQSDAEPELERLKHEMLFGKKNKLGIVNKRELAKVAMVTENCHETRLSQPTINLLIIKSISADSNTESTNITLLDGTGLKLPWYKVDMKQRCQIANILEKQIISIYKNKDLNVSNIDVLRQNFHLDKYLYVGDEESSISVLTSDEYGNLYPLGQNTTSCFCYKFGDSLGYLGLQNLKGIH